MRFGGAWKEPVIVAVPAMIVIALAFVLALQWVKPAPPTRVVIATGRPDGAYYHFALRYRERLARQGAGDAFALELGLAASHMGELFQERTG